MKVARNKKLVLSSLGIILLCFLVFGMSLLYHPNHTFSDISTATGSKYIDSSEFAWVNQLPNCPCEAPDRNGVKLNDGWAKDIGNLELYHKGAEACYRSYPFRKTAVGNSGQQCCYDSAGRLITSGEGAGTPDKSSTCRGEDKEGNMKIRLWGLLSHYRLDVIPWKRLLEKNDLQTYRKLWPPNQGIDCSPK